MRRLTAIACGVGLLALTPPAADAQTKPAVTRDHAHTANYTRLSGQRRINSIVIHTVEGSASSARHWFKNPRSEVSAHYIVDFDGSIVQMVADKDRAWHARGQNRNSIGIEHAGYTHRNQWTDAMYRGSARLARWLCDTYGIPKDREHILGHVEVPGTRHREDPGPHFDWDYYMRLVRGDGERVEDRPNTDADPPVGQPIRARTLRPGADQTLGLLHVDWREGNATEGYPGLTVEWSTSRRRQRAARVFVISEDGELRYDSGSLSGSDTTHTVTARLKPGKRYSWRVRVWDGDESHTTEWVRFNTDFSPPRVVALSPRDGLVVRSSPTLRWSYDDPDGGSQASYRVYLDDDADHSTLLSDSKELNGSRPQHHLRTTLKPDQTYYWRVMGYDGHGNPSFSKWVSFRTSPTYGHTATGGITTVPITPLGGTPLPSSTRPVLQWSYHNGEQRPQTGFRVQIEGVGGRVVDETYRSSAKAYRANALPPGDYRWRVGASDGHTNGWTPWTSFRVSAEEVRGMIDALQGR